MSPLLHGAEPAVSVVVVISSGLKRKVKVTTGNWLDIKSLALSE